MTNAPTNLPIPTRTADKEQQLLIDIQQVSNEIGVLNSLLTAAYGRKRELIQSYCKQSESIVDKSASSNPN